MRSARSILSPRSSVERTPAGFPVLVDGAQAVAHLPVDVRALECDFYVFSGHKVFGPTGIGVLYGRERLLETMPPYQAGGGMINAVTFERTLYADLPHRFEAGTPHIAGAVGLAEALNYLGRSGSTVCERTRPSSSRMARRRCHAYPACG